MNIRHFCFVFAIGLSANVLADPFGVAGVPGFVIHPDQRFDPYVQRLLARAELRAMPIGSSGLLYLVPVTEDPYRQELQIRYLEQLIDKKGAENVEPPAKSP